MLKHLPICLTLGRRTKKGNAREAADRKKRMCPYLLPPIRQPPKCNECILQFGTGGWCRGAGGHRTDPL